MSNTPKIERLTDYGAEAGDHESIYTFAATFLDGSKLKVIAKIPNAPLADMTPQTIKTLDLETGKRGEASDGGKLEMWKLQENADARRAMIAIQKTLEASR